ncbi:MAG: FISUMP domain-containing protein [Bacteroidales bacterium]
MQENYFRGYRKGKRTFLILSVLILAGFIVSLSCRKEKSGNSPYPSKLTGYVQKGPFKNGSITLYELDAVLRRTGKVFYGQVIDESGQYVIENLNLKSPFVEVVANGYYFNEISGKESEYHLTLAAISNIEEYPSININLISDLEIERIRYYISNDYSYSDAKILAQNEVTNILGFGLSSSYRSEMLDISQGNDGDAVLLAFSIILQGNRSTFQLNRLLELISSDIKNDGVLDNDSLLKDFREVTLRLDLAVIKTRLEEKYNSMNIRSTAPGFETYIDAFFRHTSLTPTAETGEYLMLETTSVKLQGALNPFDKITTVYFDYGKTEAYGDSVITYPGNVKGHIQTAVSANLTGLFPKTLYHYRIKVRFDGGCITGSDKTFTTRGDSASILSASTSSLTASSVVINCIVNPGELETSAFVEYGKTESYGTSIEVTPSPLSGNSNIHVSADLINLEPGINYHFRIKAVNRLGPVYSTDYTFTTLGGPPIISISKLKRLKGSSVILNGYVNANYFSTSAVFEFGETPDLGTEFPVENGPVAGSSPVYVTKSLTGLNPETTYYYRLKASNILGTVSSPDSVFTTPQLSVYDVDGNEYPVVKIGKMIWMGANLKVTHFNDNSPIEYVAVRSQWIDDAAPGMTWYNNDESLYKNPYGALYNYNAVDTVVNGKRNLCPVGWHIPNNDEWLGLARYLGGWGSGGPLMEQGTLHWRSPNTNGTDETAFGAVAGGEISYSGVYQSLLYLASFHSSSKASYGCFVFQINYAGSLYLYQTSLDGSGWSVRCLKNN